MGSVSRGSIKTGSGSSSSYGLSLSSNSIRKVRRALNNDASEAAGEIVASSVLNAFSKVSGIDLLIAVFNGVIYLSEKIQQYEELVSKYGEEEAKKRIAVEIGVDAVKYASKEAIKSAISEKVMNELEEKKVLPPELKEHAEEVIEDVIEFSIDKLEEQFLEE